MRATDHRAVGPDGQRWHRAYLDNRRMLHGRTAFDPSSGRRHLQGCYLDRTMVLSRLHTLRRQADYRTL